ncbi:THxN family PEP-CTERM protein [Leptolyngbyaceae cyanobacterium UHCC 1019]
MRFAIETVCQVTSITALVLTVTAPAQAFSFNTSGAWDAIANPEVAYQTVGAENQIRWGTGVTSGIEGKSGLGFAGKSGTASFGTIFNLGTLRHFNNPIFGFVPTPIGLTLNLNFGGTLPVPAQTFLFNLAIDETNNALNPCPYSPNNAAGCSDKISFAATTSSNSFTVDQKVYTLELLGFSPTPNGTAVNEFISEENGINQAFLFGRVVETETSAAVPEPTAIAGVMLAGAGFRYLRRRQRRS